ncbi:FAD-dependent oxidoreductase [Aeoliella sp.]|uniref:FAD-dependent oxidoreductase n=1 Tax=Aeoliella sp. TaxID=2795800 RepID=UPI003CCBA951
MNDAASAVVWKQAVQFDEPGGWVEDCQFIEQMGYAYLLATGLGTPVEDATTTVELSTPGTYRLWVRCKDWYPSHSPGQFRVTVDGVQSPVVFGRADTDQWQWVDGGAFECNQPTATVRLVDQTGWWSRCDAVILSLDPDFRPSDELQELQLQRQRYGAISTKVEALARYDTVVFGGGLAGVSAAVAAARHGAKVALLQDRPVLGGNTSEEICVPALGDETREPFDPRETGIIEECDPALTGKSGWSTNLKSLVDRQENLDVYLDTRATRVDTKESCIESVEAMHVRSGQRWRFTAHTYIDCTGDATIGHAAGANFRHGKESRDEHQESLAPAEPSKRTMGNTLHGGQIVTEPQPTEFTTPAWAYQWRSPDDFEQRSTAGVWSTGKLPVHFEDEQRGGGRRPDSAMGPVGCWYAELGGMYDTIADAEFIRDELFRLAIGLWGYVKNHDPEFQQTNAKRRLAKLNHIAGKRESRRLLGDYILTQHDYSEHVVHEDTVAYGGWTIDDHHPHGYFAPGPLAYHAYLHKVSIPYRCLYSRNVSNLMMAGRNVSATHVGFSGIRVMRTCATMGQAAGTAAAIARRGRTCPRGVYESHLAELQQALLRDGAYLLGATNQDEHDLARTATIRASSVAEANDIPDAWLANPVSKWGTVHRLDTRRAVMFRAGENRVDSVDLWLRNNSSEPRPIDLALYHANTFGDFADAERVAECQGVVPASHRGWVSVPLSAELQPGEYYYLTLPATAKLDWELYPYHAPETLRGYDGPKWGALWGCYRFRLHPGGEPAASGFAASGKPYSFAPENVIDGYNRAVSGEPHSWAPDPKAPLPQWLELTFPAETTFNTVHVTYQLASLAPRSFRIEAMIENRWTELTAVEQNDQRRQILHFNPCTSDRLRLTIEQGPLRPPSPLVPVCEVRVYNEPV